MGQQSNIDWTDSTWNPIRGCTNISPGCVNCYAAKTARRFSGPGKPFEGLVRINGAGERTDDWNGEVHFVPEHLLDPLKWGEVFIESPSVVIGEDSNGNKYVAPKDPAQLEDVFERAHMVHIKSKGSGGAWTMENLRNGCPACHLGSMHTEGKKLE
jgi:hypothetical protein